MAQKREGAQDRQGTGDEAGERQEGVLENECANLPARWIPGEIVHNGQLREYDERNKKTSYCMLIPAREINRDCPTNGLSVQHLVMTLVTDFHIR